MSTPPEVKALIEALAGDIYEAFLANAAWDGEEHENHPRAVGAARFLSRHLVKRGWGRAQIELPKCPYGTPICFDPEPHTLCMKS
ncbi:MULTISPECIES: hypothetical protein [Mycobacterium]|uniref:Uncharacterized protein n=1 Tax=Mycobacterium terramassiliense TaxID=1841859 RepID=A0A2U3NFY1_9MYCO|nr:MULTISPECIES: hypothetical protein [Mycobacterium]MCV7090965.1 hypothetical protein [Mycobacterium interjectum]SPM30417.1 hypothetical protein MTAB308_3920 [Mycobacterium terramassiliense]